MKLKQLATRVDEERAEEFEHIARELGTTTSDVLRVFVSAFNANKGYPFDVRLNSSQIELLANDDEAMSFAAHHAGLVLNEEG